MKNLLKKKLVKVLSQRIIITIIVLLILAGISISMISSQSGILNKAIQAKKANEEAIDEEKIQLMLQAALIESGDGTLNEKAKDYLKEELDKEFGGDGNYEYDDEHELITTSNVRKAITSSGKVSDATKVTIFNQKEISTQYVNIENYDLPDEGLKLANGYITNFNIEDWTTIEELKSDLPDNYTVWNNELTEEITTGDVVTGYTVKDENGNIVGVCIIFGDLDCDGQIDLSDALRIVNLSIRRNIEVLDSNYFLVAADLNHNGIIENDVEGNAGDSNVIIDYVNWEIEDIPQNILARDPSTITVRYNN